MNSAARRYNLNRDRGSIPAAWMYRFAQLDQRVRHFETLTRGVSAALHQSISGPKIFNHWVITHIGLDAASKTEMMLSRAVFEPTGGFQRPSEATQGHLHYVVEPKNILAGISIPDPELSVWSYKRTVFLNTGATTGDHNRHSQSFVLNVLDAYADIVERKFSLKKSMII